MPHFELHSTESLASGQVNAIVALKSQHWLYPLESQRQWFSQHVSPRDWHVLGWANDRLLAYLRIVWALGAQGPAKFPLAILDTVCVDRNHQKQGIGLNLMQIASRSIDEAAALGLLGCQHSLVAFYARCGWTSLWHPVVIAPELAKLLPQGHSIMVRDPHMLLAATPLHSQLEIVIRTHCTE
jgi:predicted GNAT family N-acyltransferase